jgi:hypothetical protein
LRYLRFEGLPLFESTLKGGLHLHFSELTDCEIRMLGRFGLLVRAILELGKLKPGEGDLGRNLKPAAISIAS